MYHYTTISWKRFPYEIFAMAVFVLAMTTWDPGNPAIGYVGAAALLLCFVLGVIRTWLREDDHQLELEKATDDAIANCGVDIWALQGDLMRISDQKQPSKPTMHAGVFLYAALLAEELSETFIALRKTIGQGWAPPVSAAVAGFDSHLEDMALALEVGSLRLRASVSQLPPDFEWTPTYDQAVELLDGATDVAVVLAGFGLATGLPVREGYEDVGLSNLSKANPVTGIIDKDPSGKWIKGSQFHKPNLGNLLRKHYSTTPRVANGG